MQADRSISRQRAARQRFSACSCLLHASCLRTMSPCLHSQQAVSCGTCEAIDDISFAKHYKLIWSSCLLQYYADDTPQDDPEDFDANRAALGLRPHLRKVQTDERQLAHLTAFMQNVNEPSYWFQAPYWFQASIAYEMHD